MAATIAAMPQGHDVRLIICDRDGVINADSDNYIRSPDEWLPLPGSIEALAKFSRAGYIVTVATNQSGIGRGLFAATVVEQMHWRLRRLVYAAGGCIDLICYCPHTPADNCDCRKPKDGLYQYIATVVDLPLSTALVIGDSRRDLEPALQHHARAALVKTGKGLRTMDNGLPAGVAVYDDLAAIAKTMC